MTRLHRPHQVAASTGGLVILDEHRQRRNRIAVNSAGVITTRPVLKTALSQLEAVFPATVLESERAFGEGGTTYLDGDQFVAGARGKTWPELDPEFLEHHHDAMLFLVPETFGAYLPAYVAAVARGGPAIRNLPAFLRGVLTRTRDPQRFDTRIGRLSKEQLQAIASVLVEIEASISSRLDKEEMAEVVDSYWRDLSGKGNP